jgi:glycosyltransferase involved in cell wall biosynthesis
VKVLIAQKIAGIAGSEKYMLNLLPALNERGVQAEFLLLYSKSDEPVISEFEKTLQQRNTVVHKVPLNRFVSIGSLKQINRIVLSGHYDVVHSNLLVTDLILALVKFLFNKKMVLVSCKHGYEETYTRLHGFDPAKKKRNLYWWCAWFAEKFINESFAVSRGVRNLFIGLGLAKKDKIALIPLGFNFDDDYQTENPSYRWGVPQLVVVGRLTAYKGHRFAIEAVRRLKEKHKGIRLVIVGKGEAEEELRDLVNQLGVADNVVFTGFQARPREIMYNSDIVLMPSISEGFGIVALEAMSVKRPVVAFDVPAPSEIFIHGKTGLLAKPYSVEEYAALIGSLIESESLRRTLARNAEKQLKEYYTLQRMVMDTIFFYESVANRHSQPAAAHITSV